jgi:dihydroorotate dehydrogenase electron transfer subunit
MAGTFQMKEVNTIVSINQNTVWLSFECKIDALPGQFVMVWLPKVGEKPFSIASIDPFGLLVVDVGPFSHALHQLDVGDHVWIKGPLGKGFSIEGDTLLLVAGGYGSAPLLSLAQHACAQGKTVVVCLGAKNQEGLLLTEEFLSLGCQVTLATEDGSCGQCGLVTEIVEDAIRVSDVDTLFACGPVGMLSALAKVCHQHQINYQLSWEAHMRCGMGLCGSCEVQISYDSSLPVVWLACYDGPVFVKRWD